jgi:hypothetical protein
MKWCDVPVFKVGDKLWLEGKDITNRPTKKLDDLRLGPYKILEKSEYQHGS